MAAVLYWHYATGNATNLTSSSTRLASAATVPANQTLYFNTADSNTQPSPPTYPTPLIKPTAGTNYSFEKGVVIKISNEGAFTQLSNLRFRFSRQELNATAGTTLAYYGFRDRAVATAFVGTLSGTATTGPVSTSDITWQNNGGSALGVHTAAAGGSDIVWSPGSGASNEIAALLLQLRITSTATGGPLTNWDIIAVYDEV